MRSESTEPASLLVSCACPRLDDRDCAEARYPHRLDDDESFADFEPCECACHEPCDCGCEDGDDLPDDDLGDGVTLPPVVGAPMACMQPRCGGCGRRLKRAGTCRACLEASE